MTALTLPAEGRQALRNMSAPPRSTLTLHPFQVQLGMGPVVTQGTPTNWGLAWYARVNFDWILEAQWPRWAGKLRNRPDRSGRRSHLRLCGAVALARIQDGIPAHPRKLEEGLGEELADGLLRRVPGFDRAGTLPAMMLATRASQAPRNADKDPVRALIILTHLTGRTCDPSGSVLLSESLREGYTIDLWTPEASHV